MTEPDQFSPVEMRGFLLVIPAVPDYRRHPALRGDDLAHDLAGTSNPISQLQELPVVRKPDKVRIAEVHHNGLTAIQQR